jgi:hypothetical protein
MRPSMLSAMRTTTAAIDGAEPDQLVVIGG